MSWWTELRRNAGMGECDGEFHPSLESWRGVAGPLTGLVVGRGQRGTRAGRRVYLRHWASQPPHRAWGRGQQKEGRRRMRRRAVLELPICA
jgi:hypothetical protein